MKLTIAFLAAVLTACGGGGDSTPAPIAITTTNPAAAWAKLLTSGGSWTTTGTGSDGAIYQFAYKLVPSGNQSINGSAPHLTVTSSVTIKRAGVIASTGSEVLFLNTDNTIFATRTPDNICVKPSSTSTPPAAASFGANGPLYAGLVSLNCSSALTIGTVVVTWGFESDQGAPMFCVNRTETQTLSTPSMVATTSSCIEVSATGDLLPRAKITATATGGFSVTTRN